MRFISNIKVLRARKRGLRSPASGQGKNSFTAKFPQGKKRDRQDGSRKANCLIAADGQKRLLESFRMRKNAEWKEYWKQSEISNFPDGDEDKLREVFVLTRRLLIENVGSLNDRFIQNDALLEKALGKVHRHLPLPVRLILWKKKYIHFILTNRERLTS